MSRSPFYSFVDRIICVVPELEVIERFNTELHNELRDLRLDPLLYANGSVPRIGDIPEELSPGKVLVIDFYQIRERATTFQIQKFLVNQGAIDLGGLGLKLMKRFLPLDIFFIAFENQDPEHLAAMMHNTDGYYFMILKKDSLWDNQDGFVCITEYFDPSDII